MTDKIMIDDHLEDLSEGQLLVITARAARSLGYTAAFTPEGVLQMDEDIDPQSDEFLKAWEHEACLFVATQITAAMVADGLIYVDRIDEDGNYIYAAVPGAEVDEG